MSANLKFQRAYNRAIQELVMDSLDPEIVDGVVFDTWEDDRLMFQYKGSVIHVDAFLGRPIRVHGMSYYTHIVPPNYMYEPGVAEQMSVALQTIKRIIDAAGVTAVADEGSTLTDDGSDECTQKKPESLAHTVVASVPSFDAVFETVDDDAFAPEKLPPIIDWNTMNGGDDDHDDADAANAADAADAATDKDIEWTTVTRKKKQPKIEKKNWKRGKIPGAARGGLLA